MKALISVSDKTGIVEFAKELESMGIEIISTGGTYRKLREENVNLMKRQGKIILLTASAKTIFERVRYNDDRPILNNNMSVEFISSLMKKREEKYLNAADIIIDTDNKSIIEVCKEIILSLNKMDI